MNRVNSSKNRKGGKTKNKTALNFGDYYDIETPMIPKPKGKGARRSQMIKLKKGDSYNNTYYVDQQGNQKDANVALVRFVWKGSGTEEERLAELDKLCKKHGLELQSEQE